MSPLEGILLLTLVVIVAKLCLGAIDRAHRDRAAATNQPTPRVTASVAWHNTENRHHESQ